MATVLAAASLSPTPLLRAAKLIAASCEARPDGAILNSSVSSRELSAAAADADSSINQFNSNDSQCSVDTCFHADTSVGGTKSQVVVISLALV